MQQFVFDFLQFILQFFKSDQVKNMKKLELERDNMKDLEMKAEIEHPRTYKRPRSYSSEEQPRKIRATNMAHFVDTLANEGLLWPLHPDFETIFFKGVSTLVIGEIERFPPLGGEEVITVQPFFDHLLPHLCSELNSQYEPFRSSRQFPAFGTRTPDAAFYLQGRSGSLALVLIGEHKGRSSDGDFASDEVGHLLEMAQELLYNHHVRRRLLFCYLSDGYRYQFFRVTRTSADFEYQRSRVFVGQEGVQRLGWLLMKTPDDLGHDIPTVPNWELESTLGRGGQAVVYLARSLNEEQETETVVVKEFRHQEDRDREVLALQRLADAEVTNVPQLIDTYDSHDDLFYIISTPVGREVMPPKTNSPRNTSPRLNGCHFCQIVDALQAAHEAGLLHRDVKPENIFLVGQDDVFLNDWGLSILVKDARRTNKLQWQGTLAYHAPRARATKATDLVALVRTVFALYRGVFPPNAAFEADSVAFWQRQLAPKMWRDMLIAAKKCDYDGLRKAFRPL